MIETVPFSYTLPNLKPTKIPSSRYRLIYLLIVVVVVSLGLSVRKMAAYLPDTVNIYLGDILWALMVYMLIRLVSFRVSIKTVAVLGLSFCFLIEMSQLYHSEWIDNIRKTTLGALVLGFGFLWSDLLAYTLGILAGVIVDYFLYNFLRNKSKFTKK